MINANQVLITKFRNAFEAMSKLLSETDPQFIPAVIKTMHEIYKIVLDSQDLVKVLS